MASFARQIAHPSFVAAPGYRKTLRSGPRAGIYPSAGFANVGQLCFWTQKAKAHPDPSWLQRVVLSCVFCGPLIHWSGGELQADFAQYLKQTKTSANTKLTNSILTSTTAGIPSVLMKSYIYDCWCWLSGVFSFCCWSAWIQEECCVTRAQC